MIAHTLSVFGWIPWWGWTLMGLFGTAAAASIAKWGFMVVFKWIGDAIVATWKAAYALVERLPVPWRWALLAMIVIPLVFAGWLYNHDEKLAEKYAAQNKTNLEANDKSWTDRIAQARVDLLKQIAVLQAQLVTAQLAVQEAQARRDTAEQNLAQERGKQFDALRRRKNEFVNDQTDHVCPDLPLGVILRFNEGGASANDSKRPGDHSDAAANDGRGISSSSGISINTFGDYVEDTQRALGTCRDQVDNLHQREAEVVQPFVRNLSDTLRACMVRSCQPQ